MPTDSREAMPAETTATKPASAEGHRAEKSVRAIQGGGQDSESVQLRKQLQLDAAASKIGQVEELKPEKWNTLDSHEREAVLDSLGKDLMHIYGSPSPPLVLGNSEDSAKRGNYSDEEYRIFMNQASVVDGKGKLLGDDPKEALRTYAHEWRHGYQYEQANVWRKPQFANLVDDQEEAARFAKNIPEYVKPPPTSLYRTNPEEYQERFSEYKQQPVEADANQFADQLVAKVFGGS